MASLALAFGLDAPPAHAGSYTGVRTSGTTPATITPASAASFSTPQDAAASATVSPGGENGPGSSCTVLVKPGTTTDAFTWVPASGQTAATDPPPSCVLVQQYCSALWYTVNQQGAATATGTADPGLSGTTPTTSTYGRNGPSQSKSAILWSQQSGSPFSVSCTPSASFTGTVAAGALGSVKGEASVGSMITNVYPITLNLSGTTPDSSGNLNILVGQDCTASLNGIPSGCTVSNWKWSVTGTTFQSWSASNSYTIEVDGPGPTAYSTASWFWDDLKTESDTVTCTVTVTPPSGQGSPFPLTVTQPVKVVVPAWSCQGIGGTMQVNTLAGSGNGTDYWLYAGPAGGSSTGRGMDWVASVTPPGAPFSGSGSLEMVQTETPNSTYTSTAGVVYTRSNNGQQGLDTSYPYGWQSAPPSPPSYESGDSPGLDLIGMASAQLKYTFVDTLMYEPPGGYNYVPIATFTWSTNGNAQIPATKNWADYGSGSAGAVTPSGTTNFTASNTFPSWTQNVGNGTWSWVASK